MLGGPEMLGLVLLAVLLFGANKLPKLARSSGQAIGEFQKGREQVEQELEEMKGGSDSSETSQTEPAAGQTEPPTGSGTEPQVEPETKSSFDTDTDLSNE